jgi:hypothetical protein
MSHRIGLNSRKHSLPRLLVSVFKSYHKDLLDRGDSQRIPGSNDHPAWASHASGDREGVGDQIQGSPCGPRWLYPISDRLPPAVHFTISCTRKIAANQKA